MLSRQKGVRGDRPGCAGGARLLVCTPALVGGGGVRMGVEGGVIGAACTNE